LKNKVLTITTILFDKKMLPCKFFAVNDFNFGLVKTPNTRRSSVLDVALQGSFTKNKVKP